MSSSSSSSSSAGGKRIVYSSSSSSFSMVAAMLMIIMLFLQIWVCRDCQVGAIRIFSTPNEVEKQQMVTNNNKSHKEGDLVRKYFGGSAFNFSRTEKGIADDKRRVPSCPDPLHN